MVTLLKSLWKDESGQATVEYALVIGLASIAVTGAIVLFKDELIKLWTAMTGVITAKTTVVKAS
jgi:Flp pilus assembly pilin Flp